MKIRPRLLIGSLVAAVLIVAAFAIYGLSSGNDSNDHADDSVTIDASTPFDQAPLNTNAAVTGTRLAAADVRTADGDVLSTAALIGQPLVINYWSSTCVPCKKELPDFVTAHRELGDKIRFVGIDAYASLPSEVQFAKDRGVDYELYYDGDGRLATALGLSTQPVTLFVRADGTIMKQTGQIDLDDIRADAAQLLG